MNREPFSKSDLRLTIAVAALIILCAVYVRLEYFKAFPQASIKLRLTRDEVTRRAQSFLNQRGFSTTGFRQLTVFDPDDDARLYLERELGLERANQLMEREVSIWRWRARWFRPPEQEELLVWASPDQGRIQGFEHIVQEAAPGARLTRDQAFQVAQDFVRAMSTAPAHLVEDRLEQKPNRNDYLFTWEQDQFRAKEATYRRTVVVQGDNIGRYLEFLYVPEGWRREFAGMRSKNELYAAIAEALWVPLVLTALYLLVTGIRRRDIPWRPLLLVSGVVGALMIASQLGSIPLLIDRFPTSSPYYQTLLLIVLMSLGSGVGVFFYVVIAGAAGEPVYSARFPALLSLRAGFTRDGLGSRPFYRSVIAGYGFAAAHIAFLIAFYLIGRRFGVWSPQDVQYSDLLSTALPFLYPVAIASMAASSEEFWFRLLAIPVLMRLVRVRWIAVVVPAFVWGFLHANYPQQPAWIRGVEVGLIGVAAGFLMLRFGILATLVWHYTVDAVLIGTFLLDAASWFYRLNAALLALAVLAPLIVSVVMYRRNHGFVILDRHPQPEEPPATSMIPAERVPPVQPRWSPRVLYIAAAAAGVLGIAVSPQTFGDWIRVRLDRTAAEDIAVRAVPDANNWRRSTNFISNLDAAEFEYLRRVVGTDSAERIVRDRKPVAVWRTRFFRPLEKEEHRLYVDQAGAVVRRDHILDELAPGDRLSADDALRRASSLLLFPGLALVDSNEQRREKRTDWTFVFEDPKFHAGDARARISLELHGNEPSNYRRFLKLPEEWVRDFQKPRLRNFVVPAVIGSMAMPLLIIFLRRLGSHETVFHWRIYLMGAGAAALLAGAASLSHTATAMSGYDTATPEQNHVTSYVLGLILMVVAAAVGVLALLLAVDVFRQAAIRRAALTLPTLPRAVAVAVLLAGTAHFTSWLIDRVPGPRPTLPVWNVSSLDAWLPGLHPLTQGCLIAILAVCSAGVLVFAGLSYMRPKRRLAAAATLVAAMALAQSLTPAQFGVHAVAAILWFGIALLIILTCAADLVGLGVAVFWVVSLSSAVELIQQPASFIRGNGIGAAIISVLLGLSAIVLTRDIPRRGPSKDLA